MWVMAMVNHEGDCPAMQMQGKNNPSLGCVKRWWKTLSFPETSRGCFLAMKFMKTKQHHLTPWRKQQHSIKLTRHRIPQTIVAKGDNESVPFEATEPIFKGASPCNKKSYTTYTPKMEPWAPYQSKRQTWCQTTVSQSTFRCERENTICSTTDYWM